MWDDIQNIKITFDDRDRKANKYNDSLVKRTPKAILNPKTINEVQQIVHQANQYFWPIYPISKGKNYGFGSATSTKEQSSILDLSALCIIDQYDANTGTVRIQPGVTFSQLASFLQEHGDQWQASITGGPVEGSVLGNALERGDGVGLCGDRERSIFNLRVVLGTGEIISTGHESYGFKDINWHESACGPGIKELFIQSNLGVVCQATLQLQPKHQHCLRATYPLHAPQDWHMFISNIKQLVDEQILHPRNVTIWNQAKQLARQNQRIFTPKDLLEPSSLIQYTGSVVIPSQNEDIAQAKLKVVKYILTDTKFSFVHYKRKNAGIPSDKNLKSLYWEKQENLCKDPDKDGCGALWICPTVMFQSKTLLLALSILEKTAIKHGFHPNVGLQLVSRNACHAFLLLNYDKEVAGAMDHAMRCQNDVIQELDKNEIPQVRLGVNSMDWVDHASPNYKELLLSIKKVCDPNMIISPGRYIY